MVRVRAELIIIHLLFVFHSSILILCTTRYATIGSGKKTPHPLRSCGKYDPCRKGVSDVISSLSILEGNSSMRNGKNLTSDGGVFTLGFFVTGNNTYLGIWYTTSPEVMVWVANKDRPITPEHSLNCSLVLGEDGIARVFDSNLRSYWSTSLTGLNPSKPFLQIQDNGNLVLRDRVGRGGYLWQSFHYPTDTFLLGMDIVNLTSWTSAVDPSQGNYLLQQGEGDASNDLFMYNLSQTSTTPYWGNSFNTLPSDLTALLSNNKTNDSQVLLRLVMNSTGRVQLWKNRTVVWEAPKDECDLYNPCGFFGVCDSANGFRCKCLPGYTPNELQKWESKDFSSGCFKNTNHNCGQLFLSLPSIKLPTKTDNPFKSINETDCKGQCMTACGCTAYTFDANQSRCLIWSNELNNIQEEYYNANAYTLHIRLDHSDIGSLPRTCSICGANVIPYPLSTNHSCGDPTYFNFVCNNTNGQVYFKPQQNGTPYKVSIINPGQRKFTIQLLATSVLTEKCDSANDIESKELKLHSSSPYKVTNCNIIPLMERPPVVEVELSWKPPLPPACNSSADCTDWPETTCNWDKAQGKKVCLCENGFHWDPQSINCTKGYHHKHVSLWQKIGIVSGIVLFLLSGTSLVILLRTRQVTCRADNGDQFKTDDIEDIDIPFVDYQSILAATDNFSDTNKLGAGGFGPVYKGILGVGDGSEVAIKRLSATSVQGVLEFRNEIVLIAKLQHRNLVRVVGYCIKEEEKILIYEYMPNKSLDSFLFDPTMSTLLDWMKRFDIILGIARGLLYLHQDSRLRIIHRDLKPSNILLDEELNPKISDFGLAKIIAGKDMATNTARVVGTYGYMSPEYALEGYFSTKSDVYSFGIIVFEVISGKRCSSLLQLDNNLVSLLGYAWALWKEGREVELVNESISDTCDNIEVKRCINVALLCVQEDPSDRPTMSSVLLMLGGDSMNLPDPKQPVFVARRHPSASTSSSKFGTSSNVELTTTVGAR